MYANNSQSVQQNREKRKLSINGNVVKCLNGESDMLNSQCLKLESNNALGTNN